MCIFTKRPINESMERRMFNINLIVRKRNEWIRERTKVTDENEKDRPYSQNNELEMNAENPRVET